MGAADECPLGLQRPSPKPPLHKPTQLPSPGPMPALETGPHWSLSRGLHLCPIISLPSAPGMIRGQVLTTIQSLWMQTLPCRGSQLSAPWVAAREGLQGRRARGRLWGQGPWSGVCPAPVRGRAWHPFRCGLTGRKSKALAWATCWPATCLPSDWKQPASSF